MKNLAKIALTLFATTVSIVGLSSSVLSEEVSVGKNNTSIVFEIAQSADDYQAGRKDGWAKGYSDAREGREYKDGYENSDYVDGGYNQGYVEGYVEGYGEGSN
ncbi:hypothetical protein [Microcoleus vaginatus]|uniref:hypothetical protein n=1 Tax=Microcoleus vaginatus TaxID=119532 RepID=UPI001682D88E|nr:hypothetical protein [Microcoleus sp. FACHB-84]MBD2012052.1 hypothetical protein [Microcoleus sp. FACHB-45]